MQVLLLPVREDWYALELLRVREVLNAPAAAPLPTAPATVLGLFNLRGQVVPLLDTGALLGLAPLGEARTAVVIATKHGPVGLAASGPAETAELPEAAGPGQLPATRSWHEVDGRVATLVDADALVGAVG
jgi:purine-binding chemotaxis protein CheW